MTAVRKGLALVFVAGALAAPVEGAQLRFRYAPVDAVGNTTMVPYGPAASVGHRTYSLGLAGRPTVNKPRPTHLVTFRHPATGREVTVPMAFPEGTPRVEYAPGRVVYNYGSYTVAAHFYRDGTVEVVYDSGLFRGI
jgi:hypothetical protein